MSAPTAAEMKQCFDQIDVDGGGALSLHEVAQAMEKMKVEISPADLARSFARADTDNQGELDLQEFTKLVQSLEHGPVEPTPTDRRSEAAVELRKRRHRHVASSRRLDTTSYRHQWTSAEDAKRASRRTADRVVHRATWARQPEDWGGLRAGFEDTLVEPWDDKLDLPEWQRNFKPPAWLRRAEQKLSGAEDRRSKAKNRLRAISSQAATLQRESDYTIAEEVPTAQDVEQDRARQHIDNDDASSLADPSFSQLRRNHAEQLRRIDTAQSVEHFLYYLPADQAARFGHLHDQLVESRPSTAGDSRARPARLSALSPTTRRSSSRSGSRSHDGPHSRGNNVTRRSAPLSFARLRSTALEGSARDMDNDVDDLEKWGGWADDIHAIRDQELQSAKRVAQKEIAAATARERAAQHADVMADLQAAVNALRQAEVSIERYRKAFGNRVGWMELVESLQQQAQPNPEAELRSDTALTQGLQSAERDDCSKKTKACEEQQAESAVPLTKGEKAARRARLVRGRKLVARANMQALKLSEQEVTARATAARAEFLQSKAALAFAKRGIALERARIARAALAPTPTSVGVEGSHQSLDSVRQLEKTLQEAGASMALEEYSLLALKDEQANLHNLLHEVDTALPLTTRRSGLSQAKSPHKAARIRLPLASDARHQHDPDEDAAGLLSKAEVAANQLELLGQRVAECRQAALRSLAARLRQIEEELQLRKGCEDAYNTARPNK